MAYDGSEYRAIIADAAKRLETAIRASYGNPVHVWAVFTTDAAPGRLHIGLSAPEAPLGGFEVVRPRNAERWAAVPYSHMYSRLYDACHNTPILSRN